MDLQKHFTFADSPENPTDFLFCWHGHTIAYFKLGGIKEWHSLDPAFDNLFVMDPQNKLPMFLNNLKPEGWLQEHLNYELQTDYIRGGRRFLSNVVIFHRNGALNLNGNTGKPVMIDERLASLADFTDEKGIFTGNYKTPRGMNNDPIFENTLAPFWESKYMPRFSGAELKFPVCLNAQGDVDPALQIPFNAIAKYPGRNGHEALGVNEFLGMKMARAAGLETPAFALVDQGNGLPPVYLIERYDIPVKGQKNTEWMITQDFCTLMQKPSEEKSRGSIEKVGEKIAELSKLAGTDRTQENLENLFKRAVFGWVINDEDMHLKNLSLLYKFDPETKTLKDISFAPCYDPTTDVFTGVAGAAMSLTIGQKATHLTMHNFISLAQKLGIYADGKGGTDAAKVTQVVSDIARNAAQTAIDFASDLPSFVKDKPWTYDVLVQVSHVADRARRLGVKGLPWDSQSIWKDFPVKRAGNRELAALKASGKKPRNPYSSRSLT